MKCGFTPENTEDWQLLLRLAKLIRLMSRNETKALVTFGEQLLCPTTHPISYKKEET